LPKIQESNDEDILDLYWAWNHCYCRLVK